MAIPRIDPLPAFHFLITLLDTSSTFSTIKSAVGAVVGGFSECSGLESTLETFDYLEGGVNDRVHRFPARFSYSNIVLKRGMGLGDDLWLWHKEFLDGKGKRRDGLIILQNELRIPIKTWTFTRGLPTKWSGPSFNAMSSELAIETLEIAHEKLELTLSPGAAVSEAVNSLF
ncbi:MAG TPA: phage tail protein [Caldilineaceae bacterium]|nr:phage tail protein [Caldilineaceae bacterium]